MPGTDLTPERRATLVRSLTIAGWLLLGGPIAFIAFQFERMRGVIAQPFAGVWDQRIEVLSFVMLPPNLVVLVPAVAIACLAMWLAGSTADVWLVTLVRTAGGIAVAMGVVGVISIVSIVTRHDQGPVDLESVFLRIGGVTMAAGLALLCRTVDRLTT